MTDSGNLLAGLPEDDSGEVFETLFRGRGVRVERIVSTGQASPEGFWYEQSWDEWVMVVQGRARLQCEGGAECDLRPGDWISLPAGRRHRVVWTQAEPPTVWLAVHGGEPTEERVAGPGGC